MEWQRYSHEELINLLRFQQERIALLETKLKEFDQKEQLLWESERWLEACAGGKSDGYVGSGFPNRGALPQ